MSKPVKRRFKLTTISLSSKERRALEAVQRDLGTSTITETIRLLILQARKAAQMEGIK